MKHHLQAALRGNPRQSVAQMRSMNKHYRRTADRKLKNRDWRRTYLVLTDPNRHTLFSSTRIKN
jgi:hypothetical protein